MYWNYSMFIRAPFVLVSHSTIRVLCAGRVLAVRTQPRTHQGYQEWTSLPRPPPLPPPAHLAMRMLPETHRFSPSPHSWKPHNVRHTQRLCAETSQTVSILGGDMSRAELWICRRLEVVIPPPVLNGHWVQLLLLLQTLWGGGTGQFWRIQKGCE